MKSKKAVQRRDEQQKDKQNQSDLVIDQAVLDALILKMNVQDTVVMDAEQSRNLAALIYLITKSIPQDITVKTTALVDELELSLKELARQIWRFNNTCKDVSNSLLKEINLEMIAIKFKCYLKDIPEAQHEIILSHILNSGSLDYQPTKDEIENKDTNTNTKLMRILDQCYQPPQQGPQTHRESQAISILDLFNSTGINRISH